MFKICSDSYDFGHTCPPNRIVRNVWRASSFGSAGPLGPPLGRLGRQDRPRTPEWFRLATFWAAHVAQGCPPDCPSERAGRVPSVGGSAMHMKWPDGIGAKCIPGLPVVTGPPLGDARLVEAGRPP